MSIITLATDFGTSDGYVGEIKGVIKALSPNSKIIDITHDLIGIKKTSLTVSRYYSRFPDGTIHMVIVDPTVGSNRKAIIGVTDKYIFVGPDNGIFSYVQMMEKRIDWWSAVITKIGPDSKSSTFHGRDVFAPAAAMLALGRKPDEFCDRLDQIVILNIPVVVKDGESIIGEIIDIDHFGNLITNIIISDKLEIGSVTIGNQPNIPFVKTFSDVAVNSPLAYKGSGSYLEIGINSGRANEFFNSEIGMKIRVNK
jgi:S-adenosylmethionine hydrolase